MVKRKIIYLEPPKNNSLTGRFTESETTTIEAYALANERSVSWVIRKATIEYLAAKGVAIAEPAQAVDTNTGEVVNDGN